MSSKPLSPEVRSPAEEKREAKPHVLIIDAQGHLGALLEQAFTRRGWSARHALDGHELLRSLEQGLPAAVVANLEGGELDGLELSQWLSPLPERPLLLLFSLRATPADLDQRTLEALGVDLFLPRPCLPNEVINQLEELLHGSRAVAAGQRSAT